ncbi:MAG: glycosyltransferase [Bacteroidetes bacterium]|nr:MAG: glycosyltransferase [Bacteroidota bacterium]REK07240.1 MAG: glycosyltransferase [Bacteroidota bacterium]REK31773.1 MAG: glycosyltransferase [Bacteroidota bacterium]REK48047.1 MAG: glycosyltransferase [Bacteroidota bacterium]
MKKVVWQTKTTVVADSFTIGKLSAGANGGNVYDVHAAEALRNSFVVEMDFNTVMRTGENMFRYWMRMKRHAAEADVIIREPYPIVFGNYKKGMKYVGMIHHIDDEIARSSFRHKWYFRRLKRKLRSLDLVITVSEFWKSYLENIGCRNVEVIYNGFDLQEYNISVAMVEKFKSDYNIPADKKLIYAGNAVKQKGIYDVYDALKSEGYHLLMSGSRNQASDLPVQYLHLSRSEYIVMLHACDLVISLSRMTEGWNRIAHEALLCGTPVIGSGAGGMRELLEGAGQEIVVNPSYLADAVRTVLSNSKDYSSRGKEFALTFSRENFNRHWNETINRLIS